MHIDILREAHPSLLKALKPTYLIDCHLCLFVLKNLMPTADASTRGVTAMSFSRPR